MTILAEIYAYKQEEVPQQMLSVPLESVQQAAESASPALDFVAQLSAISAQGNPALIAEVKHCSPSRGVMIKNFDPLHLAQTYVRWGAAAISVLTDQNYFGGSLEDLQQIAARRLGVPLLRKDFIFHPYQIFEARAAGADAILLIAGMLDPKTLADLLQLTRDLGMSALVEVHSRAELEIVLELEAELIGINNRDLRSFSVSLKTFLQLRPYVPAGICLVAESGIHTREDVQILSEAGVDAILVGEAIVTSPDIPAKIKELAGLPKGLSNLS